ncbi:unnamed protein product [Moneuplotes crassus]|uniref:Uncharacterized protein n=1 Tax=Euplotes crassus TaxID=5936 RepID=A0AAD1UD59_EUPCR|nr:unnamed protein product [Moneuplotes crassus]
MLKSDLEDYKSLKAQYTNSATLFTYNSENEDTWTILSRIILENPECVKKAVRTARDELFHLTGRKDNLNNRKKQQEEELRIFREIEMDQCAKERAKRLEKVATKKYKRKRQSRANFSDVRKDNTQVYSYKDLSQRGSLLTTDNKEKSPQKRKNLGKNKRILLRKKNEANLNGNETCEQSFFNPNHLRKVVSQKEIGSSKFKGNSQTGSQKMRAKMVKRGPFPSERLYNLEKIKSTQQSLSKIQTSREKDNQDDSLYKYIGAPYDSSGIFRKDKRLKMPTLFKSIPRKGRKKTKNFLPKNSHYFEGAGSRNGLKTRVLSTSPESSRINTTGLLPSKNKNIATQPGSPVHKSSKISVYLTKVSNMIKLPKMEMRNKVKKKPQVREKERPQCTSQIIRK